MVSTEQQLNLNFANLNQFAGKELWPSFLSRVLMAYQQPIFETQKRYLSSVKADLIPT